MWTHDLDPVAFSVGGFGVRWYGLLWVAGFVFTWWYLRRRARLGKVPFSLKDAEESVVFGFLAILAGGRLGAVLIYYPDYFLAHPLEVFALWRGGLSFHGGLVAVLIFAYFFARSRGIPVLGLIDAYTFPLSVDQVLGRIGNFVNGELYGRVTSLPWGMAFPKSGDALPRHPTQLYEAGYNIAISIVLFLMRDTPRQHGFLLGLWLVLYALARIAVEALRVPDEMIGPLTVGQALCLPMLAAGAVLLVTKRRALR